MTTEKYFEYGYRITSGVGAGQEVWQIDHGIDGVWTPWDPELGIGNVDIHEGVDVPARIREELDKAKTSGVILRREVTVTTGPVEEIGHAPQTE